MAIRACIFCLIALVAQAATVETPHYNNSRTGANAAETTLTPALVVTGGFGLRCRVAVDGDLYSQPLWVQGATYPIGISASMHNTAIAFNPYTCAVYWTATFGTAWQFPNYPHLDGSPLQYGGEIGAATIAVDGGYAFMVTISSTGVPTIRKLSVEDGSEVASSVLTGSVVGTGDIGQSDTTSGANLTFYPAQQMQRTALAINNGNVYIGFGSMSDIRPYHGWLFSRSTTDLSAVAIFCSTPNSYGGGIWNGGAGVTVLANGDVAFATGNGNYDGITEFGQSIVILDGTTLALKDWYTPSDWATMNISDSDLGSGPVILIPGTTKLVTGAKDFRIFAVDSTCLGHLGGSVGGCGPAQVFFTNSSGTITDHSGVYNGAVFNGRGYFPNTGGSIYAYTHTAGVFNTTPTVSTDTYEFPGAQMSVTANGTSNAILWAMTSASNALYTAVPGRLRALNPVTLAEYKSWTVGTLSKYAAPTAVNGLVMVSTQDHYIYIFGPLPATKIDGHVEHTGHTEH